MGRRREYEIRLNSVEDAIKILNIIKLHNKDNNSEVNYDFDFDFDFGFDFDFEQISGEFLYIIGYLNFKNECWMVLLNHGGEIYTCDWFNRYFPSHIEWYNNHYNLPKGWLECNDFIWESDENEKGNEQKYELPQNVIEFINKNKSDENDNDNKSE